jgi:nucleoside-diphosphate-sugar epimerase
MARIFVTGAGGFVGRALVPRLLARGHQVTALVHAAQPPAGVTAVRGDLLDPAPWRHALDPSDIVMHLAAATGRALPAAHRRVNVDGTRALLEACRAAGGRRFFFVSSVAAGFPSDARYPYARAKAEAEALVRSSLMPCLIARPTMVVGPDSPILAALRKLAALPLLPVFGPGDVPVQPIHVADLAEVLADLAERDAFAGGLVGIGGPEVLTIEDFLRAVRRAVGHAEGPVVHLPLGAIVPVLSLLETFAYRFLPLTVGQLATFRYDGTVPPDPVVDARRGAMRGVAAMLAEPA